MVKPDGNSIPKTLDNFFSNAFYSLGKAVHFIQDLNNPYHSSNYVEDKRDVIPFALKWSDHSKYEEWTNNKVSGSRSQFAEKTMNFVPNTDILSFGKAAGNFSHVKDEDWDSYSVEFATTNYVRDRKVYTLGRNISKLESYIKHAERDTAQIIYSFYLDTH